MASQPPASSGPGRTLAWALGAGGALPFLALALAPLAGPVPDWAWPALVGYGALILSFLGGIRWGRALGHRERRAADLDLLASVLPSLYAWPLLLVPSGQALPLLAAGFAGQWLLDERRRQPPAPSWFLPLRRALSATVIAALLLAGAVHPV
ncbi:MAG: DUF3429 domain-containing protein [Pseudoxanthomonas sp.]|nr:DUF3429 domain-containing protein [Pseudoxanthomonas sp.]